jgi:apolipoprotein N-acyltransferase
MAVDTLPQQRPLDQVQTKTLATSTTGRSWAWSLLPPLATAGLLYLCHFPVAWGPLAWVAFVPLLSLVRSSRRARAIYWPAFLGGLVCYVPLLQWFRVADDRMIAAWIFLSFYCALYWPLTLFLLRLFDRRTRLPLVLTAPAVWTALEYFRAHFGSGFSWYLLGYTQHDFLHVLQVADITGVYGLSFLVMAVNALLAEVLLARSWWQVLTSARPGTTTRFALFVRSLTLLVVLLGVLAYGDWRLRQGAGSPGPRLALLQGNISQQVRNGASVDGESAVDIAVYHYLYLADLAVCTSPAPNLLVWPETSWPETWSTLPPGTSSDQVSLAAKNAMVTAKTFNSWWRTPLVVGVDTLVEDNGRTTHYNSAHLIGPDGLLTERYDKIHRVPLGEYVPLRETLPFMKKLAPYDFDYSISEGQRYTRFKEATREGRNYTFGVIICYEDTVPDVVCPYGGGDDLPTADFLLNISNDGWFDGTAEHDEHLAICRFRAVENRRGIARSVNMGISAVIDGNGRVLRPQQIANPPVAPREGSRVKPEDFAVWEVPDGAGELSTSEWHLYKKRAGVLLARIPLDTRSSLYARLGDWVPGVCWCVLLAGCGLALLRPRPVGVT